MHNSVSKIFGFHFSMANSYSFRLETHHVPAVTENLVQVEGMAQVEIDQFWDPVLPELLAKKNFRTHQNVPYLLDIEELHGMVRIFRHIATIFNP